MFVCVKYWVAVTGAMDSDRWPKQTGKNRTEVVEVVKFVDGSNLCSKQTKKNRTEV